MSAHPFAFSPHKPVRVIARVFGAPLAVQGMSWLPVNQLLVWALFAWLPPKNQRPVQPAGRRLLLSGLKMAVLLGSEWCHNLAHVFAARAAGRPVDAVRIVAGMPILLYNEPEHPSVSPRQHLIRSLGGPLINLALLGLSAVIRRRAAPGSAVREAADAAFGMNAFLASGSLLPVQVFDGGPVLKWSLVLGGLTPQQAEEAARRVNRVLGPGLLGAAALAAARRRWLLALILAGLGGLSASEGRRKPPGGAAKRAVIGNGRNDVESICHDRTV